MIFAVMVLFIATLLVAGAFAAVEGDVKLTRTNTARDKAYYAAEAGLQVFCTTSTPKTATGKNAAHPEKVAVPGASEETYSYETLPSSTTVGKKMRSRQTRDDRRELQLRHRHISRQGNGRSDERHRGERETDNRRNLPASRAFSTTSS